MSTTRRHFLALGSGSLLALAAARPALATAHATIEMRGTPRGEHIWFAPIGLAIAPGTRVRFVNHDPVNSHTATVYHPDLFGRSRRIPEGATAWDSGFLLPDQDFEVMLQQPGVYDFYCLPHEMVGMVGRIVVGQPSDAGWQDAVRDVGDLPDTALAAFPDVGEIVAHGRIDLEQMS